MIYAKHNNAYLILLNQCFWNWFELGKVNDGENYFVYNLLGGLLQ